MRTKRIICSWFNLFYFFHHFTKIDTKLSINYYALTSFVLIQAHCQTLRFALRSLHSLRSLAAFAAPDIRIVSHRFSSSSCSDKSTMTEYVFNGKNIKFCPGPCKSTAHEAPPTKIGSEMWHQFKPYSGGNYTYFTWQMSNRNYVTVKNIRPCAMCNSLYMEITHSDDFGDQEFVYGDAVFEKLKDLTPEVLPLSE